MSLETAVTWNVPACPCWVTNAGSGQCRLARREFDSGRSRKGHRREFALDERASALGRLRPLGLDRFNDRSCDKPNIVSEHNFVSAKRSICRHNAVQTATELIASLHKRGLFAYREATVEGREGVEVLPFDRLPGRSKERQQRSFDAISANDGCRRHFLTFPRSKWGRECLFRAFRPAASGVAF